METTLYLMKNLRLPFGQDYIQLSDMSSIRKISKLEQNSIACFCGLPATKFREIENKLLMVRLENRYIASFPSSIPYYSHRGWSGYLDSALWLSNTGCHANCRDAFMIKNGKVLSHRKLYNTYSIDTRPPMPLLSNNECLLAKRVFNAILNLGERDRRLDAISMFHEFKEILPMRINKIAALWYPLTRLFRNKNDCDCSGRTKKALRDYSGLDEESCDYFKEQVDMAKHYRNNKGDVVSIDVELAKDIEKAVRTTLQKVILGDPLNKGYGKHWGQ